MPRPLCSRTAAAWFASASGRAEARVCCVLCPTASPTIPPIPTHPARSALCTTAEKEQCVVWAPSKLHAPGLCTRSTATRCPPATSPHPVHDMHTVRATVTPRQPCKRAVRFLEARGTACAQQRYRSLANSVVWRGRVVSTGRAVRRVREIMAGANAPFAQFGAPAGGAHLLRLRAFNLGDQALGAESVAAWEHYHVCLCVQANLAQRFFVIVRLLRSHFWRPSSGSARL